MKKQWIFGAALLVSASAAFSQSERSGEQIVKMQCSKCHATGAHGAPRIDDRAAWTPRMKNGLEATVRSAINGHGKMPARGGLPSLSDTELRNAILYMFYPAGEAMKKLPAAEPASPDPHRKRVSGMDVYLGIVLAESSPGAASAPAGKGYYYVNITVRDAKGAAIKDAQLDARVANPVTGGEAKKLEANAEGSYGNVFRMQGTEPYTIAVRIKRPAAPVAAEAKFEFRP